MWLSKQNPVKEQVKRLERELKALHRACRQIEARGCFSDRELAAKEAELEAQDRRRQILELERNRLQLMYQRGGGGGGDVQDVLDES